MEIHSSGLLKQLILLHILFHHDTVLDITHESLIRNWNKLNTWANQEFEFYSTYVDLKNN